MTEPDASVAVHSFATVSTKHPVALMIASRRPIQRPPPGTFYIQTWGSDWPQVRGLLAPLADRNAICSHQYLLLYPDTAPLVVSVGEYDEQWWRKIDA